MALRINQKAVVHPKAQTGQNSPTYLLQARSKACETVQMVGSCGYGIARNSSSLPGQRRGRVSLGLACPTCSKSPQYESFVSVCTKQKLACFSHLETLVTPTMTKNQKNKDGIAALRGRFARTSTESIAGMAANVGLLCSQQSEGQTPRRYAASVSYHL